MYYYSKRSRSKIVHQSTCQHIQNVSVEDVGSFENLEDAYAAGYRLCRHCSPIAKLYRKESDVLQGYCQSHAASVFFKDRFIGISTPISDWRIIPSGKGNEVVLYHKNTLGDKKTGPVPRYHLQWARTRFPATLSTSATMTSTVICTPSILFSQRKIALRP